MPPKKRPIASEVNGDASSKKKKVDTPKKGDVAEAIKASKSGTKGTTENVEGIASTASKGEEVIKEKSPKKAARKSKGSTKADEAGKAKAESTEIDGPIFAVEESGPVPKKKRATQKKADKDDDTPRSLSAPPAGGSKMDTFAAAEIPKNMTIDDPLVLDNTPKKEGTTRIMSWNILSFKSSLGKGLVRYLEAEQADVAILTETKCNDVPMMPALAAIYPHQTWGIGKTKGYAGIALLSKIKPLKVTVGIPDWDSDLYDTKGRIVTAEYERYIVIGTYVVNAGEGLKTLPQKQEWNNRFAEHLAKCDARKPTLWTGDLNVVLDARDLSNASKKWDKSAGYTSIECEHHRRVLSGTASEGAKPYVDIWRDLHPDAVGHYTYYGFRGMCRSKGIGWRLDSHIIPQRIADQVEACEIRHTIYGASDHVPVYMDIKGTL